MMLRVMPRRHGNVLWQTMLSLGLLISVLGCAGPVPVQQGGSLLSFQGDHRNSGDQSLPTVSEIVPLSGGDPYAGVSNELSQETIQRKREDFAYEQASSRAFVEVVTNVAQVALEQRLNKIPPLGYQTASPSLGASTNNPPENSGGNSAGHRSSGFVYDDFNNSSCLLEQPIFRDTTSSLAYGTYFLLNKCSYPIYVQFAFVNDGDHKNWNGGEVPFGIKPPGGFGGVTIRPGGRYTGKTWFAYKKYSSIYYVCKEGWSPVDMQDKHIDVRVEKFRCRHIDVRR